MVFVPRFSKYPIGEYDNFLDDDYSFNENFFDVEAEYLSPWGSSFDSNNIRRVQNYNILEYDVDIKYFPKFDSAENVSYLVWQCYKYAYGGWYQPLLRFGGDKGLVITGHGSGSGSIYADKYKTDGSKYNITGSWGSLRDASLMLFTQNLTTGAWRWEDYWSGNDQRHTRTGNAVDDAIITTNSVELLRRLYNKYIVVIPREISTVEFEEIAKNPYQIIKPRRKWFVLGAGAGGITVQLGLASENAAANALSFSKAKAVGQNTEVDLAQSIVAQNFISVSAVSENDLASNTAINKSKIIAQAAEADTPQPLGAVIINIINPATEVDSTQSLSAQKTTLLAQAAEQDLSQSLTQSIIKPVQPAAELDASQGINAQKTKSLGQVSSTEYANLIGSGIIVTINQTQESSAAQSVSELKQKVISQAFESEFSQSLDSIKIQTIGQTSELTQSQTLTHVKNILLMPASEVEIATPMAGPITVPVGLVSETDTALDLVSALIGLGLIENPSVVSVSIRRSIKRIH
jgi:hypothetical protein